MKRTKISMLALAAMALCACTNEDIVLTENSPVAIGGDGYVSLAINLPTEVSSRAANDNYNDGLPSEYAVNDATLLLFGGASETEATCYGTYNLTTKWEEYGSQYDNITSRSQVTQKIDTPTSGSIYALVVLNAVSNKLLSDVGTDDATFGNLTLEGATLGNLQSKVQELGGVSAMTSKGFFMCNAPLISAPGGATDPSKGVVTTLAEIDGSKIFSSAAEAESHPATEIYVERGMAKVTVVDNTPTTPGTGEIAATINGFILDLTNNVSYLVRNATTGSVDAFKASWWGLKNGNTLNANQYRFAGNVPVSAGLYRTYWATDPNYDVVPYDPASPDGARDYGTVMTSLAGGTPTLTACGDETPLYCLENTFNVSHMNQDETTRAIIGATLNGGKDFFIWDNDKTTIYSDESRPFWGGTKGIDEIKALILTQLQAEGYMKEAEAAWVGPTIGLHDMYSYITIVFDEEKDGVISRASDDLTFRYTISSSVRANWFVDSDNKPLGHVPDVLVEGSDAYNEVVKNLNDHHQVAFYKGGQSYYPVLIEHFGSDLAPWDEKFSVPNASHNAQSYPENVWGATSEANWLGRYGVLRNNWYEINVTGVHTIGSATVPTAYGDPDDPTQKWMSFEINILSWAKRTQDVTL